MFLDNDKVKILTDKFSVLNQDGTKGEDSILRAMYLTDINEFHDKYKRTNSPQDLLTFYYLVAFSIQEYLLPYKVDAYDTVLLIYKQAGKMLNEAIEKLHAKGIQREDQNFSDLLREHRRCESRIALVEKFKKNYTAEIEDKLKEYKNENWHWYIIGGVIVGALIVGIGVIFFPPTAGMAAAFAVKGVTIAKVGYIAGSAAVGGGAGALAGHGIFKAVNYLHDDEIIQKSLALKQEYRVSLQARGVDV